MVQRSSAQPRLTPANTTARASATARQYANSYSVHKDQIKGQRVLLVDDVCKTGATLNHFTGALQRAGFEVVRLALGLNYKLPTQPVDASAAPLVALPQALPAQPPKDALLLDKISALSEIGSTPEDAAMVLGMTPAAFTRLLATDNDASQRWNKGRLESINQLRETLHKHALSGSVQAAKYLLSQHLETKKELDARQKPGRPRTVIPPATAAAFLAIIASGDTDKRAASITGITPQTWARAAKRDPEFKAALDEARAKRNGHLAQVLRESMERQILKGSAWWAKLAIHNYEIGLKDPDLAAKNKIKNPFFV